MFLFFTHYLSVIFISTTSYFSVLVAHWCLQQSVDVDYSPNSRPPREGTPDVCNDGETIPPIAPIPKKSCFVMSPLATIGDKQRFDINQVFKTNIKNKKMLKTCLKCSFAETEPVWEVKEGVRFIFEGEGGVPPDRLGLHGVTRELLFSCPRFQSFHYVDLKQFSQFEPIKSQEKNNPTQGGIIPSIDRSIAKRMLCHLLTKISVLLWSRYMWLGRHGSMCGFSSIDFLNLLERRGCRGLSRLLLGKGEIHPV